MRSWITLIRVWRWGSRTTLAFLIFTILLGLSEPTSAYQSSAPFSGRLVLDGEDDYADTPDHSDLDIGGEADENLTIEAWVNFQRFYYTPIVYKPDAYFLFGDYDAITGARCIGFHLWSAPGQPRGFIHCRRPGPGYGWHHVAGVLDKKAGTMKVYLDGQSFGSSTYSSAIHESDYSLQVGKGWWAGGYVLKGEIDELRISDVARYTEAFTPPASPFACDDHTRALWHFDELEGSTIFHDACGAADNVLTGYNGAHTEGVPAYRVYCPLVMKNGSRSFSRDI